MEREFLELAVWGQFTTHEADVVGRAVARCLPAPWGFDGIESHSSGDQRRQVAFFRGQAGTRFALIPAGAVLLGYDPSRPLGPELQVRRAWLDNYPYPEPPEDGEDEDESEEEADARFEYNSWIDFFAWLTNLPVPRTAQLGPYLMECESSPCQRRAGLTFRQLSQALAEEGLRLPTSDEWEHACAGGARTVWRWGDICPDYSPEDSDRNLIHWQANAFGMRFFGQAGELCAEPGIRRNTDGGVALCGGHGWPCAWLAQASAFVRDYYALGWDAPEKPLSPHLRIRRAFSVPEEALD
jgi:hypothetical protein